jgi:hypothetical protein
MKNQFLLLSLILTFALSAHTMTCRISVEGNPPQENMAEVNSLLEIIAQSSPSKLHEAFSHYMVSMLTNGHAGPSRHSIIQHLLPALIKRIERNRQYQLIEAFEVLIDIGRMEPASEDNAVDFNNYQHLEKLARSLRLLNANLNEIKLSRASQAAKSQLQNAAILDFATEIKDAK